MLTLFHSSPVRGTVGGGQLASKGTTRDERIPEKALGQAYIDSSFEYNKFSSSSALTASSLISFCPPPVCDRRQPGAGLAPTKQLSYGTNTGESRRMLSISHPVRNASDPFGTIRLVCTRSTSVPPCSPTTTKRPVTITYIDAC
jgi:hypothetical protein